VLLTKQQIRWNGKNKYKYHIKTIRKLKRSPSPILCHRVSNMGRLQYNILLHRTSHKIQKILHIFQILILKCNISSGNSSTKEGQSSEHYSYLALEFEKEDKLTMKLQQTP
jgi:hypothetical protein